MIEVDTTSFFLIVLGAVLAAVVTSELPSRLAPPVVVLGLLAATRNRMAWLGSADG